MKHDARVELHVGTQPALGIAPFEQIEDDALDFHRERRGQTMTRSLLDDLPGVGPARKRALLQHFGSPDRIVDASREELEAVPGMPGKVAREIHRQLHKAGR